MRIFDNIRGRFHLRFKDRQSAGTILGEALKDFIKKRDRKNCVVLGIPRGGVITGYCVAKKLGSKFDIIMPRKLCAPDNEELAIGAVTGDGTTYINDILVKELDITSDYIAREKLKQLKEIERRTSLYHSKMKTITGLEYIELRNKTIILADDGTCTGATMIAAERSIIKSFRNGCQIIIATPVAPKSTVALLRNEDIDHIEVISSPRDSEFTSVEHYYYDFHQVTDQEVIEIITKSKIEES
jgi:putative phosphoribosyl transferase